MKNYVAIMAGGVGSRFWPASREARPKQFLDILGVGKSLLQLTFERFLKLCPATHIFIVTHEQYYNLVKAQLPQLQDNQILCEPSRNNTAPCVAYMAFKLHSLDPEANFVVAPSDHIILKEDVFIEKLLHALAFTATNEAIVTLGIEPSRPDTGYGYVHFSKDGQKGVHKVLRFQEKPPLEKARTFVDSGEYLWNAGIFVWSARTILKAFEEHSPDIHRILEQGRPYYNTLEEQEFINLHYPLTPKISVDYAILEKSPDVYTIPADIGWSDLGTWVSLHTEGSQDDVGNVVQGGDAILQEVSGSLIRLPEGKLAVVRGVENFIVVDEGDVLLIWPKDKEQEIKEVAKLVREKTGRQFL